MDQDAFKAAARAEADELAAVGYGDILLPCIGKAYESAAERAQGGVTAIGASFRAFGRKMGDIYDVAKAASEVVSTTQKLQELELEQDQGGAASAAASGTTVDEDHRAELLAADVMPAML